MSGWRKRMCARALARLGVHSRACVGVRCLAVLAWSSPIGAPARRRRAGATRSDPSELVDRALSSRVHAGEKTHTYKTRRMSMCARRRRDSRAATRVR